MAVIAVTPDLAARLTAEDHRTLTDAADHGHTEAVQLMLDLGFPPGTRSGQDDGATALHFAAATVSALLDAGASTGGIILSPDDPKPSSPEVAALLAPAESDPGASCFRRRSGPAPSRTAEPTGPRAG